MIESGASKLWVFLVLMILIVLGNASQEFHRMFLNLSLPDVFHITWLQLWWGGEVGRRGGEWLRGEILLSCDSVLHSVHHNNNGKILLISLFISLISALSKTEGKLYRSKYLAIIFVTLSLECWSVERVG
jgi:hypothetical protein